MEDGFKHRRDKGVSSLPKLIAMGGVPTPMFMDELVSFCRRSGMKHVEIQEEGNDLTELYPTAEDLIRRAEDVSKAKAYGGRQPEGIVIRPKTPVFSKRLSGNLSMKVINNKYLLKNED